MQLRLEDILELAVKWTERAEKQVNQVKIGLPIVCQVLDAYAGVSFVPYNQKYVDINQIILRQTLNARTIFPMSHAFAAISLYVQRPCHPGINKC